LASISLSLFLITRKSLASSEVSESKGDGVGEGLAFKYEGRGVRGHEKTLSGSCDRLDCNNGGYSS